MSKIYIVDGKVIKEENLLKITTYSNTIRICEVSDEESVDLNTFLEQLKVQHERSEQLKRILESDKYADIINFVNLYTDLAPIGKNRVEKLEAFKEIGLNKDKFKKYVQKNKEYFILDVTTDIDYYKAYVKICNAKLDFTHHVWSNNYGYMKVKPTIPNEVIVNYNLAKDLVYPSRRKKAK